MIKAKLLAAAQRDLQFQKLKEKHYYKPQSINKKDPDYVAYLLSLIAREILEAKVSGGLDQEGIKKLQTRLQSEVLKDWLPQKSAAETLIVFDGVD